MYTKFHRRINWTVMSPTPVPAAHLWHIHDLFFTLLHLPQLVMTEGFILTITWTTNSFWILVSCRRVLSVRSFPEKNHLWRDTSISSCSSSNFFSSAMVSAMLAVRRTSFPKGEVELTQIFLSRWKKSHFQQSMHNVIFRDIQMHNSKSYQLIIAPVAGTLLCSERAEIVFASIRKPCCRWMFQWWGWQAGLKCTLGADSGCPAHRNTLWESLQKRNNPDKQPVKKNKKKNLIPLHNIHNFNLELHMSPHFNC